MWAGEEGMEKGVLKPHLTYEQTLITWDGYIF